MEPIDQESQSGEGEEYRFAYPPDPPRVCEQCKERIEWGDLTTWMDGLGHYWHGACRPNESLQGDSK